MGALLYDAVVFITFEQVAAGDPPFNESNSPWLPCRAMDPSRRSASACSKPLRRLGAHMQQDYVRNVRRFAAFLGRSPDAAAPDDIRRFQLDPHENGVGPATINGAVLALGSCFW